MLHAENITKHYRRREGDVLALDRVSLEVAAGEFVSIMGPSGCGKSTLLLTLGCLIHPPPAEYGWRGVRSMTCRMRRPRPCD